MREIIRASAWGGFNELVLELGGDPDAILAAAQVDKAALTDPDRYMPMRALLDCQAIAAERLGRKDFGLLFGQKQNMSAMGGPVDRDHQFDDGARGHRDRRALHARPQSVFHRFPGADAAYISGFHVGVARNEEPETARAE